MTRFYRAFGRIIATRTTTSSGSDVRYYVADHLGSTNALLTASGSVSVGGMKYWPFGAQRTGPTPDHGYTPQLRDDYSTRPRLRISSRERGAATRSTPGPRPLAPPAPPPA